MQEETPEVTNKRTAVRPDAHPVMGDTAGWKAQADFFGGLSFTMSNITMDENSIQSEQVTKLLAFLLYHHDRPVTVDELVEILWSEEQSDNPAGALKNLLYRLRSILRNTLNNKESIILTGRGNYFWNPDIHIDTDLEQMDQAVSSARKYEKDPEKASEYLKMAAACYKGRFLPKLGAEQWVIPIATYYHSLYLSSVKKLCDILLKKGQYTETETLCSHALELENIDEDLHYYTICALNGQGKKKLALEHYKNTENLLYENFGVKPSDRLRRVYKDLVNEKNEENLNPEDVKDELVEDHAPEAFYLCDYNVFKEIYRLTARQAKRLGLAAYMLLITIEPTVAVSRDSDAYLKLVNKGMEQLQSSLRKSLRIGDVAARYSGSQFVVLLPACSYESSKKVVERIHGQYRRIGGGTKAEPNFNIEQIDTKA